MLSVLAVKGLVTEGGAVDALTTGAIAASEVATLAHEAGDDTVEHAALVVEGLTRFSLALFTSAKGAEVLCSFGAGIGVELHRDATDAG